ncbi:MAG: SGNH/GDSL hydrolase family protein [Clostridia bacterium]|nr:SGNH/GDSL hydrolase family protein [Clostridia bacterium]
MAQFKNMYKVELNNGIAPVVSLKQIYYADVEANRIGAIVTMNGQPFPLGGTCTGSAILADGSTVPMAGVIDGNQAYIDLDSSCYSVEGQIRIFVKITTSGVTTTLLAAVGTVQLTETDTVIDPGTIIPSVTALITAIEDAVESIPADYTSLLETIAPMYANLTFPVKAGQWCWYSGVLYEANQDISTSENWTAAHWKTTTVGGEVSELKSAIHQISIEQDILPTWNQGYIRTLTGDPGADDNYCYCDYIESNGKQYVITGANGYKVKVARYNSSKVFQGLEVETTSAFPVNFSINEGEYFRIQFGLGDSATTPSSITQSVFTLAYFDYTDVSLSMSGKAADAKATGDGIAEISKKIANIIYTSKNVFDKSSAIQNAYVSVYGIQTGASYAEWFVSDLIPVNGATKLQSNISLYSIVIYNADGTVDMSNSYVGLHTAATLPFSLPATADKIRVSGKMVDFNSDIMMNFGNELLPYTEYGETYINDDLITASLKENPVLPKLNSRATSESYLASCKQALKKNVLLSYFATFTEFTSLKIGFTTSNTYTTGYLDYIEITDTDFVLHRKNQNDITWQHGLTIKDYISVHITFDFSMNFSAVVKTNGGDFTKTNYFYLGASYYPFAIIEATGATNINLSFSCADFHKDVLLFGDSYFSNGSDRWLYYLTANQQKNLCINGYAGESSPSAIVDCETLFGLCTPKFAVWCLGMNDGSDTDDTTPSTQWLSNVQKFINFCAEKNIQPILATIPSVPTINNRAKSAWVRASGYRYIDFAAAVNIGNDGSWYDNMLSVDGVHPAVAGAKALCARAITDFPEMLID